MRLLIVSDLHVDSYPGRNRLPSLPSNDAFDVIVVAGDVANNVSLLEVVKMLDSWVGIGKPLLYVAGNHEHYRYIGGLHQWHIDASNTRLPPNVHLLTAYRSVTLDGVQFLGDTLWTDLPPSTEAAVVRYLNDFSQISDLTPDVWRARHQAARKWLTLPKGQACPEKRVLVTHHAPSFLSIHPKYANYAHVNAGFASNSEDMLDGYCLATHGHVHDAMDYHVRDCRVVANPRGYRGENPYWQPLIVEI